MIKILDGNKKYKFIWAEMSFLSLWWDQAAYDQRQLLKKLLQNKQLEIVTGGWVSEEKKTRQKDIITYSNRVKHGASVCACTEESGPGGQ
jgi:alpha-mannosidase II